VLTADVPILLKNRRSSMGVALLISIVLITIGGGVSITLLLMSQAGNAETKAGIAVLFIMQVIKMLFDQFKENQLEIKRARMEAQVDQVNSKVDTIGEKSDEAIVTSRTGLAALVKSDDLTELDMLADGFSQGTLTAEQTQRFVELLNLRKQDDLTTAQLSAAQRMLVIARKELLNPAIHEKPHIDQTDEAAAISKKIQAAEEVHQIRSGTRKADTSNAIEGETKVSPSGPGRLPSIVAAAEKAADSAEATKKATEEVVIVAAREIEKARQEKKDA